MLNSLPFFVSLVSGEPHLFYGRVLFHERPGSDPQPQLPTVERLRVDGSFSTERKIYSNQKPAVYLTLPLGVCSKGPRTYNDQAQ